MKCASCKKSNMLMIDASPNFRCIFCGSPFDDLQIQTGSGFVYILSNSYMPGLLKIGFTDREVDSRVRELSSSTGVPARYEIDAIFPAINAEQAEAEVHRRLASVRLAGREFFTTSLDEAVRVVSDVCGMAPIFTRLIKTDPGPQRWLRCYTCLHEWSIPEISADTPCPECQWEGAERLRNRD